HVAEDIDAPEKIGLLTPAHFPELHRPERAEELFKHRVFNKIYLVRHGDPDSLQAPFQARTNTADISKRNSCQKCILIVAGHLVNTPFGGGFARNFSQKAVGTDADIGGYPAAERPGNFFLD